VDLAKPVTRRRLAAFSVLVLASVSVPTWYLWPTEITIYVHYSYETTATLNLSLDGKQLIQLENYKFLLPPYTNGSRVVSAKGTHTIEVDDFTFDQSFAKRFDIWGNAYVIVSVFRQGLWEISIQYNAPVFI